ncbi:MAG: NTP transferase domain-containing protein [Armatimonadetes bacterium]|nr:NTP transferase domain-containing protein [Armatimonadota bacterium]
MKAIIPAAGLGTRMRALTGGAPKELLPVAGKPVLRHVIEEALAAGAEEVVVVSGPSKSELNAVVRGLRYLPVSLQFQDEQRGLAHAVDCAKVREDAMVLMGDSVFLDESPLESLSEAVNGGAWAAISVRRVPEADLSRYGVAAIEPGSNRVVSIVEKPAPGDAPGPWAVNARYAFSAKAMETLHEVVKRWEGPGEVNLTHVLLAGLAEGKTILAFSASERETRHDCGDETGYRVALEAFGK